MKTTHPLTREYMIFQTFFFCILRDVISPWLRALAGMEACDMMGESGHAELKFAFQFY